MWWERLEAEVDQCVRPTAATERSPLGDDGFQILGLATVAEHIALIHGATATEHSHRVYSIGSAKIRHDAANATETRVLEELQREVDIRLHIRPHSELRCYCTRFATEQADASGCGNVCDIPLKKQSWSGNINAISLSIAAYHRAVDASEHENIINKLKARVQELLRKCVPNAYLREPIIEGVMKHIWNRICNVALAFFLNAFVTSQEARSQEERNFAIDILQASLRCLRTSHHKILEELRYCRRSATEQTDASG